MTHTIDFEDGIIRVRTYGEISIQGFIAYLSDVLKHERWTPGGRMLVDHRALEGFTIDAPDIIENALQLVAFLKDNEERTGRMTIASVIPDSAASSATSLWDSLRERLNVEINYRNFFNHEAAEQWLNSM